MAAPTILRSAVAIANKVTKALNFQAAVSFERYVSSDAYGSKVFASAVSLRAIVELDQRRFPTGTGVLSVSKSSVLFLDVPALSSATSGHGVRDEDRITLPDGTTGPIMHLDGFVDSGTGHPTATQVYLG